MLNGEKNTCRLLRTVSQSKVSSSLMLKRQSSSSRTNLSHIPRSSWHQLHSPGRLSSSEYDISYVHNSKIKLVHILAQVMPEFIKKSGMTFAKKDISSAWNLPERKLINTPAKHRPLGDVNWTWTATWATTYPIWATQDIHVWLVSPRGRRGSVTGTTVVTWNQISYH